jgi:hypothetical protein
MKKGYMTIPHLNNLLNDAAGRIADVRLSDLQILLRRAALIIQNVGCPTIKLHKLFNMVRQRAPRERDYISLGER